MKKTLFPGLIALAALTMTSCSNDENMVSIPQDNAIEFGTYLGRDAQTKGLVLDVNTFKNYGVFAYYTGQKTWDDAAESATPNYMFNQYVAFDGVYSPIKYWPTKVNEKITFFAYAPHDTDATTGIELASENTDSNVPKIKYSINVDNLTTQADFVADVLYDEVHNSQQDENPGNDLTTNFNLVHELTRVNILAKLDREAYLDNGTNETQVSVTKIELMQGEKFYSEAVYTFATEEGGRGKWNSGTVANSDLSLNSLMNITTPKFGGYNTPGILVPNTNPVSLFTNSQYLFLIPANGTTGIEANGDVKLRVYYDIVTEDAALEDGHSCTTAIKEIPLCKGELKQGVAYNYTLIFGLNEVKLSAEIANWDETGEHDENVNWTDTDYTQPTGDDATGDDANS